MPGTEDQLQNEMTTAYIGFDPTADSLHIGSLGTHIIAVSPAKKQGINRSRC
jgi:tyrosyl-tRNA synthetase